MTPQNTIIQSRYRPKPDRNMVRTSKMIHIHSSMDKTYVREGVLRRRRHGGGGRDVPNIHALFDSTRGSTSASKLCEDIIFEDKCS